MSRDYKPASKSPSRKQGSPMLAGILIGMFIGLGIAVAVAFLIKASPSPFVGKAKPVPPVADAAKPGPSENAPPAAEKARPADKPRFDFYTILPGTEEPVTEKDIKQQDQASAKSQYFLQVGAFQNEGEADNLKAKLALMGVESTIQSVTVPDKGVWHRVRVGPYGNVDELNKVRGTLAQNGVPSTLVKIHDLADAKPH